MRFNYDNLSDQQAASEFAEFMKSIPERISKLEHCCGARLGLWNRDYSHTSALNSAIVIASDVKINIEAMRSPVAWQDAVSLASFIDTASIVIDDFDDAQFYQRGLRTGRLRWNLDVKSMELLACWGIYFGECIRSRFPGCRWALNNAKNLRTAPKGGRSVLVKSIYHNHPCLSYASRPGRGSWIPLVMPIDVMKIVICEEDIESKFSLLIRNGYENAALLSPYRDDTSVFEPIS